MVIDATRISGNIILLTHKQVSMTKSPLSAAAIYPELMTIHNHLSTSFSRLWLAVMILHLEQFQAGSPEITTEIQGPSKGTFHPFIWDFRFNKCRRITALVFKKYLCINLSPNVLVASLRLMRAV